MFNDSSKIKRICAVDSMYSLFIYLLLSSEEDIKKTFFFFGSSISDDVKKVLKKQSYTVPSYHWSAFTELFILAFLYYIYYPLRFPFLLNSKIERWSGHTLWESAVIRRKPYYALEDGLLNYIPYTKGHFSKIKTLLFGPTFRSTDFIGTESTCKTLYLTGLIADSVVTKQSNVKIIKLGDLWESSEERKKNNILKLFGISLEELNHLKQYKKLLLTQPLDDPTSNLMTEQEKICFYQSIFNLKGTKGFLIKPHPRESTNYRLHFPHVGVFDTKIPFEVMSFLGVTFQEVYTVSSTAIFDIPYNCDIYLICSQKTSKLVEVMLEFNSKKQINVKEIIMVDKK